MLLRILPWDSSPFGRYFFTFSRHQTSKSKFSVSKGNKWWKQRSKHMDRNQLTWVICYILGDEIAGLFIKDSFLGRNVTAKKNHQIFWLHKPQNWLRYLEIQFTWDQLALVICCGGWNPTQYYGVSFNKHIVRILSLTNQDFMKCHKPHEIFVLPLPSKW